MRRLIVIGVLTVFALLLAGTAILGPFRFVSVCQQCGALRRTTDWQLPMTEVSLLSRSTEEDSPLSQVLRANGIVRAHSHQWLFAQGGGNGVKCAIGKGRFIRAAAESRDCAQLLKRLEAVGQRAFQERMVRGLLDPKTSWQLFAFIRRAPLGAGMDAELQAWAAEQSRHVEEIIAKPE